MSTTFAGTAPGAEAEVPKGRIGRFVAKYKRSYQVARSSLFWALLRRQKRQLKWMFFAFLLNSVALLEIANFTRGMVDNAIVDQTTAIWPWVMKIFIWACLSFVTGLAGTMLLQRIGYQIEFDLRVWLYTHIQSADLRRLDAVASGQLVTRSLTDLALIEQLLLVFPAIIAYLPLLLALAILVTILSPPMGILALASLPLNLWLLSRFRVRLRGLSWAELNERAEVMRTIDEPVRGIRVVKAFGREDTEAAKVHTVTEKAYRYSMTRVRLLAVYDIPLKLAPFAIQAAVLALGAHLIASGSLSLGTFLLAFQICTALAMISASFDEFASAWQYLRGAQDRIAEMLALGARPITDGRMAPAPSSGLELRGIGVDLGARRVIDDFSVQVPPGAIVVVTGSPGSGKSTIAAVASGLLIPNRGTAYLDGLELEEADPAELRRSVRVVAEEPMLFATSLRENLRMGAPEDIDDDMIMQALRTAGVEEVVGELEGGLDGYVGDRGLTLSGGQRQRVALSRALVARPRVLILDDALSAVNPSLEHEIVARIHAELPETSILFITRRAGPVQLADQVIQLPAAATMQYVNETTGATFATLAEAAALGGGVDEINAVMAVEELGEAVEASEGIEPGTPGSSSALPTSDDALAQVVRSLKITTEKITVPDGSFGGTEAPYFWKVMQPFKWIAFSAVGAVFLVTITRLAPDLLFGQVTDVVNNKSSDTAQADLLAFSVFLVGIAGAGSAYLFRIRANKFTQSLVAYLRRRAFFRLGALGVDYYDRELPGQVAARCVYDLDRVLQFLQQTGFLLLSSAAIFVIGMLVIVAIAPAAFPLIAGLVALVVIIALVQLPIGNQAWNWARHELGTVTAKFEEDFVARHEIRNLGAADIQTKKFVDACWQRRRAKWYALTIQAVGTQLLIFVATMTQALVLWRTGTLSIEGALTIGTALSVYLLVQTSTAPLRQIGVFYSALLEVRVSWGRLREPFEEPILPEIHSDAVACPKLRGDVSFDHVAFVYPQTGRSVLHDVSFVIPAGTVTALVGYTGAGKSSIAKLLSRTYDPTEGTVSVDGIELQDMILSTYIPRLGVVPQDAFVFRGTVASNISYAVPDAAREDIESAAREVGAWDLLSSLPAGFDTLVEEEGKNLTAAQRQLIALARAWMTRPDVMVLDEATSLLDADVEQRVLDAVHALGCTTLMITHRENVAKAADSVVVLDAGRVVDAGTINVVSRPGSPYDRLWNVQELDDGIAVDDVVAGELEP
jgi:ATP-binding cassette, subfamily B, bacterial